MFIIASPDLSQFEVDAAKLHLQVQILQRLAKSMSKRSDLLHLVLTQFLEHLIKDLLVLCSHKMTSQTLVLHQDKINITPCCNRGDTITGKRELEFSLESSPGEAPSKRSKGSGVESSFFYSDLSSIGASQAKSDIDTHIELEDTGRSNDGGKNPGSPLQFLHCGRCAATGILRPSSSSLSGCKKCPLVSSRKGDSVFCLRCNEYLRDSGMSAHTSKSCPNKAWLKSLDQCLLCKKLHRGGDCLHSLEQMMEFVFFVLQDNTQIRRNVRARFPFVDPGVRLKDASREIGTVEEFHKWLCSWTDDDTHSNFVSLFLFVKNEMKL